MTLSLVLIALCVVEDGGSTLPADAVPTGVVAPDAGAVAPPTELAAADRLKNSVGVGFFGVITIPYVTQGLGGLSTSTSVPLFGARYWSPLQLGHLRRFGIEVAGGFAFAKGTTEANAGNGVMVNDLPDRRGFAVMGALPVALGNGPHFIFIVAPEVRHASSTTVLRTTEPLVGPTEQPLTDVNVTDVSLRVSFELFASVLGIPNLSLEACFRMGARFTLRAQQVSAPGSMSQFITRETQFTTSFDDPVSALTSLLGLKYYF
jgi:hypothetical protein